MSNKPKSSNSTAEKEIEKVAKQFEAFDQEIKEMTLDRMNQAPKEETESQTKLSQKQLDKSKDIYLKPERTLSCREKFNDKYREDYNYAKEYVQFIAEHKEIIGEMIEIWTKKFAGVSAEFWKVPTGKPVWGPRYLAEQIRSKYYHRLVMKPTVTSHEGTGQFYGSMAVDTAVPRLTAEPVSGRKSIFMGAASGF